MIGVVVQANRIEAGRRDLYRRYADPSTHREMFGSEAGFAEAGRRVVYSVSIEEEGLEAFRNADNALSVEPVLTYGIPEDHPPRIPEVTATVEEAEQTMIPQVAVQKYAGIYKRFRRRGRNGAGKVYPNGLEVAVGDTGLDRTWAQRLQADHTPGRLAGAKNFTNDGRNSLDAGHFHGSHVAGILVAGTRLRLHVGKVLRDDGTGTTDGIIQFVYWAIQQGVRVINLSLGGGGYSQAFQDAILYARRRGVLVVCAMGNNGRHEKSYPAAYQGATGIIAFDLATRLRAPFSTYGEWAFAATHGVDFLSWGLSGVLVAASGTSMATPLASRVIALLIAEHGNPTAVLTAVAARCEDTEEPTVEEGFGRIRGWRADNKLRAA